MSDIRYSAFISYNHRDVAWARWLHKALERYRVPRRLLGREGPFGPIAARLPPVFRDREELAASSNLAQSVQDALAVSGSLIVICSPNGARSRWVNEEIRTFARLGRADRILCLIVAGDPLAPADEPAACMPPALQEIGQEPLAADLRKSGDGRAAAKLKLLAALLQLPYDELRQREAARRQKRLLAIAAAASVGFVMMAGLAIAALLARNEAVRQRDIARERTITAERTVGFVKSMFEVSDPSEARGATITAREVIDRGVRDIRTSLQDEPAVRAELGLTLGEVYGSLGLLRQADQLIAWTFRIPHGREATRARQWRALGDSRFRLGDYEPAADAYRRGLAAAAAAAPATDDMIASLQVGLGQTLSALGEDAAAARTIRAALARDLKAKGGRSPDVARDLEALGLNAFYAGRYAEAEPIVARALAIRRATGGPLDPSVSDNLNSLGNIAYLRQDGVAAERYWRQSLRVDEKVLGSDHPDVAITLNNLGRVLLERRRFADAEALLARAARITLAQKAETHDDMAFIFASLAAARRGLSDDAGAGALLEKALAAARLHKHRTLGPILTDMADMRCAAGDIAGGLRMLDEAAPIVAETYPDDPWRPAWNLAIRADCLARDGRGGQARTLLAKAMPAITMRWPAGSLYAVDLAARRARIRDAKG
ncbi:toll/interleukin-1 receptor domain-containing protein [Sphingomonas sp. 1P06PA]|uniref:toll/interleukin-1 receptor domain-containing protein n=1 Tax=Sphingomonas sp. 1P06PA TaxID=554121 RepID=UPI0039A6EDD2